MRLAFFSPLPPAPTGIAAYSATLLDALILQADITVFVEDDLLPRLASDQPFPVRAISTFRGPLSERMNMCIYQMGANTKFHTSIYQTLHRYPGVTVLHDLNLNSFFGELYLKHARLAEYTRLMGHGYGAEGVSHARAAHQGKIPYAVFQYPLFEPVVQRSLGVIVHSQFAQTVLRQRCPEIEIRQVHQPLIAPPLPDTNAEAKWRLGYEPSNLVVAAFGYAAPAKRLDRLLRAAARLRTDFPHLRLAVVGEVVENYELARWITELGLGDIVRLAGYADDTLFHTYLAATDVGFNLRYPTLGETSATLLALMAAGKPTLVSNIDAFCELPDDVCHKIGVEADEDDQIESALRRLLHDPAVRLEIGAAASQYIRLNCAPRNVALQYLRLVEDILEPQTADVTRIV